MLMPDCVSALASVFAPFGLYTYLLIIDATNMGSGRRSDTPKSAVFVSPNR